MIAGKKLTDEQILQYEEMAQKWMDKQVPSTAKLLGEVMDRVAKVVARTRNISVSVHEFASYQKEFLKAQVSGSTIHLYFKELNPALDLEDIAAAYGMFYHELGHFLLSPREVHTINIAHTIHRMLDDEGIQSYNDARWLGGSMVTSVLHILEEGRSEVLISALLPSTLPYLTVASAKYDKPSSTSYLRFRGKRHLPAALRRAHLEEFSPPRSIDMEELAAVHSRYLQVRYLRNAGVMFTDDPPGRSKDDIMEEIAHLVRRMWALMVKADVSSISTFDSTCNESTKPGARGTLADKEQIALRPMLSDADPDEADTNGAGEGDADDGDGDDPGDVGEGEPDTDGRSVQEVLEDAMGDDDLQMEVSNISKAINSKNGKASSKSPGRPHGFSQDLVTEQMREQRDELLKYLRKIRYQSEPDWHRRVDSGRLVPIRTMTGYDSDEWYDRWDEGDDSTDLSVVVLLDGSGSMGMDTITVSRASWVITSALASIQAECQALVFDDRVYTLHGPTDKVLGDTFSTFSSWGGTSMELAMEEAWRILQQSGKANKLVIALTDGDVYRDRCNKARAALQKLGARVAYGFMGNVAYFNGGYTANQPMLVADHLQVMEVDEVASYISEVVKAAVESKRTSS